MTESTEEYPILLYDGVCGFCNKSVKLILDHDKRGTMRFAALQSDYGKAVMRRHPMLNGIDSVVFLDDLFHPQWHKPASRLSDSSLGGVG
jgi:predicted DCC family thiol-disulfide oxidoreductase YuxK